MKTLIAILLFTLFNPSKINRTCLKMDIMILADMSGSVEGYEGVVASAINVFVDRFELDDYGVRIGIQTFASGYIIQLQQPLTSNTFLLKKNIISISKRKAEGGTIMSNPLLMVKDELQKDRYGAYKVVIIISDGEIPDHDADKVNKIVAELKAHNIIICGVLIDEGYLGVSGPYLQSLTTPGFYVESNYQDIARTLEMLQICI